MADHMAIAVLVSVPMILAGLAGVLLPVLPGPILIWLGMVAYGVLAPNIDWPWWFYMVQGLLAASTYFIDYLATVWGVKKFKGSRAAAVGAVLGTLLIFFIGPIGIIVGPFIGAMIGEFVAGSELKQVFSSGFGTFLGFMVSMFLKLLICGIMLAWFTVNVISTMPGNLF